MCVICSHHRSVSHFVYLHGVRDGSVQTSCKAVILPLEAANGSSGSLTDIHHVVVHAVHSERLCEEVGVVLPLRQGAVVLEQVAKELQDNEHIPLPRID